MSDASFRSYWGLTVGLLTLAVGCGKVEGGDGEMGSPSQAPSATADEGGRVEQRRAAETEPDAGRGSGPTCGGGCPRGDCARVGSCRLESVCAEIGCGSFEIDEQGCYRHECPAGDVDCQPDERCVRVDQLLAWDCEQRGDACHCSGKEGYIVQRCAPLELAGPRGEWQRLTIVETDPEGTRSWDLLSERPNLVTIESKANGATTLPRQELLPSSDAFALGHLQSFAEFRGAFLSNDTCQPVEGYEVKMRLQLDTSVLEKVVTSCVLANTPRTRAFGEIFAIAKRH
jgi:hypothetical protein